MDKVLRAIMSMTRKFGQRVWTALRQGILTNKVGLLLFLTGLIFFISVARPAFSRQTPPGGDASVYIIDTVEALKSHRLVPTAESLQIYGRAPYESSLPVAGLTLLSMLTGLTIAYPLFSIYLAMVLLTLIVLGSYLAKRLGGVFGYVPFGLATSYGFLFLLNSATLSNFSALVIILIYTLYLLKQPKLGQFILVSILAGGLLFVTHKSLTFLIFAIVLVIISPLIIWRERSILHDWIKLHPRLALFLGAALVIFGTLLSRWPIALVKYNLSQTVFWSPGQFRTPPGWDSFFGNFGGPIAVVFALVGLMVLLDRKKVSLVTLFMTTWVLISIALSLLPYVGFYFYSGRFIYEAIPFVMILAAVGLGYLWQQSQTRVLAYCMVAVLFAASIPGALATGKHLAAGSNTVSEADVEGFREVKKIVGRDQVILANYALSSPFRLGMIERRTIERNLSAGEQLLKNPTSSAIDYLMITKPDWVGSVADLDCISQLVDQTPGVELVYENETVRLFRLTSQEVFDRGDERIAECLPLNQAALMDPNAFKAELTSQSRNVTIQPGESVELRATFKNTGTATWRQGTFHLMTANPLGRLSPFIREDRVEYRPSGWVTTSQVQMGQKKVKPGETATFIFYLTPAKDQPPGDYHESFAPKVDGGKYFATDIITWQIRLVSER